MIKIFGKYRYHWQPELSWLIIYWSLAVTPIFYCGGPSIRVVLGALTYFDALYYFRCLVWFRFPSILYY